MIKIEDKLLEELIKQGKIKKKNADNLYTESEIASIKSFEYEPRKGTSIKGLSVLTSLENLKISDPRSYNKYSNGDFEYYSLTDEEIFEIEDLKTLKYLSISGQRKITSLDLSNLKNLENLEITNNDRLQHLEGLKDLKQLNKLVVASNRLLYFVPDLKQQVLENQNLDKLYIDPLYFMDALGYQYQSGNYNKDALEKMAQLSEIRFIDYTRTEGKGWTNITLNQMVNMHNNASAILQEFCNNTSDKKSIIMGIENYLTYNVKYDKNALTNGNITGIEVDGIKGRMTNGRGADANSAYNVITRKRGGVCEAYTRAMQYMLKMKGIKSHNVYCKIPPENTSANPNVYADENDLNHSIICIDGYGGVYNDPTSNAGQYQRDVEMGLQNPRRLFLFKTKEEIRQEVELDELESDFNTYMEITKNDIEKAINNPELYRGVRKSSVNGEKRELLEKAKGVIDKGDLVL